MKVQGAAISREGNNFVVVGAQMDLIKNSGEADMAIERLQTSFGGVPVVLMAQNDKGSPTYYGDNEIVRLLAGIPLEEMPWKEYSIN